MPPLLEVAQQLVTQQVIWLQTLIMLPVDAAPSIVTASAFWLQQEKCDRRNGDIIENKCRVAIIFQYEICKLLPCT